MVFTSILNYLIEQLSTITTLQIVVGNLPPENGFAIQLTSGAPRMFNTKASTYVLNLVLNGKNSDQQLLIDTLEQMHTLLNQKKDYLNDIEFQITDITTTNAPIYIEKEQNNQYLYGSGLQIKFYNRRN